MRKVIGRHDAVEYWRRGIAGLTAGEVAAIGENIRKILEANHAEVLATLRAIEKYRRFGQRSPEETREHEEFLAERSRLVANYAAALS